MFFQFITQQLASMLSDIIRRDPAAANQSPVSSAACWPAWNDRARGMPYTCADIISVIISFHQVNLCYKRAAGWLPDSGSFFFCLLLLFMSISISRGSFTNRRGRWPDWNTFTLSHLIFQPLLSSSDQTPIRPQSQSVVQCSCYRLWAFVKAVQPNTLRVAGYRQT